MRPKSQIKTGFFRTAKDPAESGEGHNSCVLAAFSVCRKAGIED